LQRKRGESGKVEEKRQGKIEMEEVRDKLKRNKSEKTGREKRERESNKEKHNERKKTLIEDDR